MDLVLGTTPDAVRDDPHVRAALDAHRGRLDVLPLPSPIPSELRASSIALRQLVERERRYYALFRDYVRAATEKGDIERVVVPYVDYCAHGIALRGSPFGSIPWIGISIRPSFHYRDCGVVAPRPSFAGIKRRLFRRLLRTNGLGALFSIDPTLVEFVGTHWPAEASRLRLLEEPAELSCEATRDEARRALRIPLDVPLVAVYGELRGRKGVAALLAACERPDFPADGNVLLAGPQFPEVRELLRGDTARRLATEQRLHVDDRTLAGSDEDRVFAAADAVWLGYQGHYNMSAVMVQAAQRALPVIACREGMIGFLAERAKNGPVVDVDDASAVSEALRRVCLDRAQAERWGRQGRDYFAGRSPESFARAFWDAGTTSSVATSDPGVSERHQVVAGGV